MLTANAVATVNPPRHALRASFYPSPWPLTQVVGDSGPTRQDRAGGAAGLLLANLPPVCSRPTSWHREPTWSCSTVNVADPVGMTLLILPGPWPTRLATVDLLGWTGPGAAGLLPAKLPPPPGMFTANVVDTVNPPGHASRSTRLTTWACLFPTPFALVPATPLGDRGHD